MLIQKIFTLPARRHLLWSAALTVAVATSVPAAMTVHAANEDPHHSATVNMFGGAAYHGEPALAVTAALVNVGGGGDDFSFAAALVAMLGEEAVGAEVEKLTRQYGEDEVATFIGGMDLAIALSLKHATDAGVALPEPAALSGVELARTLIDAGTTPDGTFWSGYLFDKAVSNAIHQQVMVDINNVAGYEADRITHKILNQAMYDVAQALGMDNVRLASLH